MNIKDFSKLLDDRISLIIECGHNLGQLVHLISVVLKQFEEIAEGSPECLAYLVGMTHGVLIVSRVEHQLDTLIAQ